MAKATYEQNASLTYKLLGKVSEYVRCGNLAIVNSNMQEVTEQILHSHENICQNDAAGDQDIV